VAANDPGCQLFQAWYSLTSNRHGVLFEGAVEELEDRCLALDALTSRIDKRKKGRNEHARPQMGRQRWRTTLALERKLAKNRRRHHEWVESGHYAAANFMLENHGIIIQPMLKVS